MTAALVVLVLLPALAGGGLLASGRRADRLAGPLAVAVTLAVAGLAVPVATARPQVSARFVGVVDGGALVLAVDGLSAVMVVTVAAVTAAVTAFAVVDVAADAARARFFGFLLLFAAAMLVTVTAATLPALLLAWEVMGATSYALIGFSWQVPGKLDAGTTAFVTTRAGDLGLYVAAGAGLAGTGGLWLADLEGATGGWVHVAAAGVLLAALGKSAQLPFSAWLSAAMEGPSPVSALLHSATMVAAGGYLLVRLSPLLEAAGWAAPAAAWVGALTALVLGAVAVAQTDLKQLLAASTAAQIGFVVLAAGAGGTAAGTAHLVAHAAVKAGLFVVAGAWLTSLGTKQLAGLRGAARRHPGVGAAGAVGLLALAGVPPLALWATKDEVLAAVTSTALRVVALTAAALSAAYAAKVLVVVLARPGPDEALDAEEAGTRRVPAAATGVAGLLAAAAVALGAVAVPAVAHRAKSVLGAAGEPSPAPELVALSAALAVAVVALVVRWPRLALAAERTALHGWAGLGRLRSGGAVLALARGLARLDERVLDRGVTAVSAGALRLARAAGRTDAAGVDGAVRGTADALLRAGSLARRPQTGLVHQYYAMAAAGLGVLLVLLLIGR